MKSIEPSACLIDTFCNKVRRINQTIVKQFLILERIMYLSVWHSTRIEPNVDKVEFACHRRTCRRHQFDVIHIRTVKVYLVIVSLAVIAGDKAFILIWVALHDTCSHRLFYLIVQLGDRTDTFSLAILTCPDRKRSSPITATAQVPVVKILKPLAETTGTG